MKQVFVDTSSLEYGCHCIVFQDVPNPTVRILLNHPQLAHVVESTKNDFYISHNGRLSSFDEELKDEGMYHLVPRLLGGKGGFGSMLRALGAQIEKTTNREACRDLSGRRMRDVNNEQKLREWVAKSAEREQDREQRRKERQERRHAVPKHNFDDRSYVAQKVQVTEELEDALQKGLNRASSSASATSTSTSRKRRSDEPGPSTGKRACEWFGVEDLDSDSDSAEEGPSEVPAGLGLEAGQKVASVPEQVGSQAEAVASTSELDSYSDSGVESVVEAKHHSGSPMDVDSDSSAKDSAMTSESDSPRHQPDETQPLPEVLMHADQQVSAESASGTEEATTSCTLQAAGESQPGLLATLAQHPPHIQQTLHCTDPAALDLMEVTSSAELETLGLDFLKSVLQARGLKCGGSLVERVTRLWAVRGLAPDQISPSLLAKPAKGKGKSKRS